MTSGASRRGRNKTTMTTRTLKIQGMTCKHCVMRVEKALKAVSGVQDADADLQKAEATVVFDETRTTPEQLVAAVAEAGYQSVV
jgi:copper chaperone